MLAKKNLIPLWAARVSPDRLGVVRIEETMIATHGDVHKEDGTDLWLTPQHPVKTIFHWNCHVPLGPFRKPRVFRR